MRKPPLQDVIVKPVSRLRPDGAGRRDQSGAEPQERANVPYATNLEGRDTRPRRGWEGGIDRHGLDSVERTHGRERQTDRRWLVVALGIGAVIILSSIVLSLLFAGATVTVYPKQDTPVVSASFKVQIDGEGGTLPFERMVIERTAQEIVIALSEDEVEERASGKITIYNDHSTVPQRLIKNTRFKSSAGRVYRIRESVEVPGKKQDTPGSIEVTVFAEEPGSDYNTGPDTFSIPGFEGLPQEGEIYAKSTGDMTGGFKGIKRTVDESDRTRALESLESQLRDELLDAAFGSSDKPTGYVLFKEAVFFEFNTLPDETVETDKVVLQLSGKLHGLLFPEKALAQRLAQLSIAAYDGSPVRIENPLDLSVTVEPVEDTESATIQAPWDATAYNVQAQGKAHFIWEYDEEKLARDLAGKDKDILDTPQEGGIRQAYPGIDNLQASVRPFWKRTFPDDVDDIVVITELDA